MAGSTLVHIIFLDPYLAICSELSARSTFPVVEIYDVSGLPSTF